MFKDRLKKLRTDKGLTQAEIAKAIGVSSATIGNYEQGTREPRNNETWKKLADFFNVSVDFLMDEVYVSPNVKVANLDNPPRNRFNQVRTDIPIYYDGEDITSMVFLKPGETRTCTHEQRIAYVNYTSRAGHVQFARASLVDILEDIKEISKDDLNSDIFKFRNSVEHTVVYWYKKCWNNIDDVFPDVTDLETLYDLINKCIIVDMIAESEFSLIPFDYDYSWLREKFSPSD